ncbi:MAG: hypothetical protein AAF328_02890 [Planctomycetota bacterium]
MQTPYALVLISAAALWSTGCASTGSDVSTAESSAAPETAVVSAPVGEVFGLPDSGDVKLIGGGLGSFRLAESGTVFLVDGETMSSVWSVPVDGDETIAIADEIDSEALFGSVLMGRYGLKGAAFFAAAQAASSGENVPEGVELPSDPIRFLVYFQPDASAEPETSETEAAE